MNFRVTASRWTRGCAHEWSSNDAWKVSERVMTAFPPATTRGPRPRGDGCDPRHRVRVHRDLLGPRDERRHDGAIGGRGKPEPRMPVTSR